ncbi:hypothetical protein CerSpe_044720 [Prunus speciosa]
MGRAPCCDKANVKRGPWSPEEDTKLKSYIEQHGTGGNWIALPQKIGLKRCGKSCRLRWLNYLRPNIKHGGFSEEEDNIICSLYISIGSRWSIIAAQLPGRTDNDIKNYWNTRLKKKLLGKQRKEQQLARRSSSGLIKQDIRRSSGSGGGGSNSHPMVPTADDQSPYWPELPVLAVPTVLPYSPSIQQHQQQQQHQPCFNDHASIRKLLIKLGGRFNSDVHHQDDTNVQPIQDGPTINLQFPPALDSAQQVYEQHSSAPVALIRNSNDIMVSSHHHQFEQTQYMVNNNTDDITGDGMHMFQGQNGNYVTDQLKEMVYNNMNPQRLDALEFLYGEDMMMVMNGESIGWGEMQLICPPTHVASSSVDGGSYEQQRLVPQELCGFNNGLSSYPAGVQ